MLHRILFFLIALVPASYASPDESFKALDATGIKGWQVYVSNGGADRCEVHDCICKVKPAKKLPAGTPTVSPDRRLSVFFTKDSSLIRVDEARNIDSFMSVFKPNVFTVIGYTDGCGKTSHNIKLAEKRVKAVRRLLQSKKATSATSSIFRPEATASCDPRARRVDIIAHTKKRITTLVDKIPADVYLIDASGSMWSSWREWTDIVSASFSPGSKVYLSKTTDCRKNQSLDSIKPSGGTEIWYSYWRILDFMKEGQTLVIISDFRSDIPLTRRESITIESKVSKKKIKVIAIQL